MAVEVADPGNDTREAYSPPQKPRPSNNAAESQKTVTPDVLPAIVGRR